MDVAIVTGAASGVGLTIARHLIDLGMKVYGLGGNYAETPYQNHHFIPVPCDLSDMLQLEARVNTILEKEESVFVLVNNAKRFLSKPFDVCTAVEMDSVLKINLLCPLLLIRMLLPGLCRLRGFIINITVTQMDLCRGGPVGAAASGGMRWMSDVLFEELRDNGVKVTNIFPQPNRVRPDLPRQNPPLENPSSIIDPEVVAAAVVDIINTKSGNIISEMILRPQRYLERAIPPPVVIPYPQPSRELEVQPFTPATAKALLQNAEKARREAEEEELAEREAERLRLLEERRQREEERRRRQEEKRLLEEERRRQAQEIRRREEEELYRRSLQPEFTEEDLEESEQDDEEPKENVDLPAHEVTDTALPPKDLPVPPLVVSAEPTEKKAPIVENAAGETESSPEQKADPDQSGASIPRWPQRKHRMTEEEYQQWKTKRERLRAERRAFHEANRKRKEEKRLQQQARLQTARSDQLKTNEETPASAPQPVAAQETETLGQPPHPQILETTPQQIPPAPTGQKQEMTCVEQQPAETASAQSPAEVPNSLESSPETPAQVSSAGLGEKIPDLSPPKEVHTQPAVTEEPAASVLNASPPTLPPPANNAATAAALGDNDVHPTEPLAYPEKPAEEAEITPLDRETDATAQESTTSHPPLPPTKQKKKRRNR